ncbi:MAG: hypothetical protein JOZ70_02150, partial [Pseudolabrys sp.]|nr:hypothetical protein [Pseudolabrys sp.]
MADTNKPAGYGHDHKGAAGGENKHAGKPGATHSGPMDKVEGKATGPKTISFVMDGKEVVA